MLRVCHGGKSHCLESQGFIWLHREERKKVRSRGTFIRSDKRGNSSQWKARKIIVDDRKIEADSLAEDPVDLKVRSSKWEALSSGGECFQSNHAEVFQVVSNILSRDSQSRRNGIQTAVFDTGAQRTILKEEEVGKYVFDEVDKTSVVIVPAALGSEFNPSRVGMLGFLYPQRSRFKKTHYMAMEVITASSSII